MCGIAGFVGPAGLMSQDAMEGVARDMGDRLRHRGPDDAGVWVEPACGLALSHRRLAIIDLTEHGHQPMLSADGRFVIVFNGETYNFGDLRTELESLGHKFRGHSDTEIMLAAIVQWGLQTALKRFNGMFAFALWDRQERLLYLARDRMGEKPLYHGWSGGVFLFGSELKALRAHPQWQGQIDRNALALFMRHNYVPAPHSIYCGIFKLMPGSVLSLPTVSVKPGVLPKPVPFWSMKTVAESGVRQPFAGTESEAVDSLEKLLKHAVGRQMVADVPLGAFLSGGIDSSTIVALMQAQSSRPVRTFTIGFREAGYNEAEFAKEVARHLGTDHTELYVTPEEAMSVIPRLPAIYDEPFSDASQIPTFLVSQLTRRHVTVSLSGDAGDELFGGYTRYDLAKKIWSTIGRAPRVGRNALAKLLRSVEVETWDSGLGWLGKLSPESMWAERVGDRLHKLADILAGDTPEEIYRGLMSHWKEPEQIVIGAKEPATALNDPSQWADLPDLFQRMMYLDAIA